MDKEIALGNLKGIGWLLIIIGALAISSKIIYWTGSETFVRFILDILFWTGIAISGWLILSSRKVLA